MAEQKPSSYYATPYKFNGKELDEETGLYYYGARYYDPKMSLWLSVDPLAEKFPSVGGYVYCFNNPVRFIDPDGMAPTDWIKWISSDGRTQYTYDVGVKTKEQAIAQGYTNVQHVAVSQIVHNDTEAFQLHSNGNVSDINGNFVDKGFYTKNGSSINENNIGRVNMFLNGAKNTTHGIIGSASAIGAIPETGGGSVVALTLTFGEIGMGFGQMINSFQTNIDDQLHDFSTIPGLAAARSGNKLAPFIDGITGWATGSFGSKYLNGNYTDLMESLDNFKKGEKTIFSSATLIDMTSDANGALEGIKKPKN